MKQPMHVVVCLLLVLSFFPLILTPGVLAAEVDPLCTVHDLSPLEEVLYRGLMATEEEIDIEGLCQSREELSTAMSHLLNAAPELFHVSQLYSYGSRDGIPTLVAPGYRMTGEELAYARSEYLLLLDEIASQADPTLTDYELCLFYHDYLCKNYAYDTTLSRFDAHTFLTEGTGVCQAYTLVYTALLSRHGIPITYATGMAGDTAHIWSIVTLDGVSYHVDVTWGDPVRNGGDAFGVANHQNFLQSEAVIRENGHSEIRCPEGITASDERYADSILSTVDAPFAFLDGVAYGIKDGHLYRFSDDLSEATLLYTVTEEWRTGLSILKEKPAGVAAYNGMLYISTPHTILAYDPSTGMTEELLSVDSGLILALYGNGNALSYLVADDIFGTRSEACTHTLPAAVPPCVGEHSMELYATVPSLCSRDGAEYFRCTVCGVRRVDALPRPAHDYLVTEFPAGYGTAGYTEKSCSSCGERVVEPGDPPLPLPTPEEYCAAVAAAENAATPDAFLDAVRLAREMEPHLDSAAIAEAHASLNAAIAAYNDDVAEANRDFGATLYAALWSDAEVLSPVASLIGVLALVFRQLFGR